MEQKSKAGRLRESCKASSRQIMQIEGGSARHAIVPNESGAVKEELVKEANAGRKVWRYEVLQVRFFEWTLVQDGLQVTQRGVMQFLAQG